MQTGIVKKEFTVPLSYQLLPEKYQIDTKSGKNQITVILQGRSRDITAFDSSKIEAKIDAKNFASGTVSVGITKEMITIPSYLSVVDIEPEQIKLVVTENTGE